MTSLKCAVTGATGLVGGRVAAELQAQGWETIQLGRSGEALRFELGGNANNYSFKNITALVHAAYDFQAFGRQEVRRVNVLGSIELFKSAHEQGVKKLIFISSISAFEGCRSWYGQGKLEVEKYVLSLGGIVVRPGLVHGVPGKGMMGALAKLGNLPILPVFDGGHQPMYLVHVDDVAKSVAALLADFSNGSGQIVTAAHPEFVEFGELLRKLAARQGNQRLHTLSLPSWLGLWALKLIEATGMRLGFRRDSLLGLLNYNPKPDFKPAQRLSIDFRKIN